MLPDWKTRKGLTQILNTIVMVVLLIAGTVFNWDADGNPKPAPDLPDIVAVAVPSAETGPAGEELEPEWTLVGFQDKSQADTAVSILNDDTPEPPKPRPIEGLSWAFIVALLNLLAQWFGKDK